jgi:hypothetical protein
MAWVVYAAARCSTGHGYGDPPSPEALFGRIDNSQRAGRFDGTQRAQFLVWLEKIPGIADRSLTVTALVTFLSCGPSRGGGEVRGARQIKQISP